jgi:hypothetical protein
LRTLEVFNHELAVLFSNDYNRRHIIGTYFMTMVDSKVIFIGTNGHI